MAKIHEINSKDLKAKSPELNIGDKVLLTGYIYTARDAAHKRFFSLLDEDKQLPFDIKDAVIYYAGPTAAQKGSQ